MIDTHCHLLPGLDDGPDTVAASVELAVDMVAQGVIGAVCTPHLSRRYPVTREDASASLAALERELHGRGVDLPLTLAAEVSDANAVTLEIATLVERSIAGRYLVVELAAGSTAAGAELVVQRLTAAGLVPVLAHPERLPAFAGDAGAIDAVLGRGALVQVMASSLTGRWGEAVERSAWDLVASGRAALVASDAHGVRRRRCHLAEARDLVCHRLGSSRWDELTLAAPERLLAA